MKLSLRSLDTCSFFFFFLVIQASTMVPGEINELKKEILKPENVRNERKIIEISQMILWIET